MERSFGGAASGWFVLDTIVEKNKPLLDTAPYFSRSQYPLPFVENQGKILSFLRGCEYGTRTKNLSFGDATT